MIVSADRSAGRPTTGWCRASFRMVKLPRYAHPCACRRLQACFRALGTAREQHADRNGSTSMVSSERVARSSERPSHHRVVPGQLQDGQTPPVRSPLRVQTPPSVLDSATPSHMGSLSVTASTSEVSRERIARSNERPCHHQVVSGQLQDGQTSPARSPLRVQTPRRDAAKSSRTPQTRARRNGLSCTMLIHSILSPIRRLHEHSMVPADVCDGQEQARSTLDGREADLTGYTGLVDACAGDTFV
jgi:hypothetical protein